MFGHATSLVLAIAVCALSLSVGCPEEVETGAAASARAPNETVTRVVLDALRLPGSLERVSRLSSLLLTLGREDIPEVRDAFEQSLAEPGEVEWVVLAVWWTHHDPAAAWEWTQSHRAGRRAEVVRAVLHELATADPQRALRSLADLVNSPALYEAGLLEVVKGWDESGEEGLVEYLVGMKIGVTRQRAIALLARRKVFENASRAERWVEALPDDLPGRFKLQAFRRVAGALAIRTPVAAAAWAERHADAPYGDGLYRHVATAWIERDPAAVMAWLATLPAGPSRDAALRESYRRWMLADPDAATAWMSGAEREPWRQPALEVLALRTGRDEPERALELAELLSDDARRTLVTISIGRLWLRSDAEAARAWLDAAELPQETREKIVRRVEQNTSQRAR